MILQRLELYLYYYYLVFWLIAFIVTVAELKVAFSMVDKDGDGKITPRELMIVMSKLGFRSDDASIKKMIGKYDADGAGII